MSDPRLRGGARSDARAGFGLLVVFLVCGCGHLGTARMADLKHDERFAGVTYKKPNRNFEGVFNYQFELPSFYELERAGEIKRGFFSEELRALRYEGLRGGDVEAFELFRARSGSELRAIRAFPRPTPLDTVAAQLRHFGFEPGPLLGVLTIEGTAIHATAQAAVQYGVRATSRGPELAWVSRATGAGRNVEPPWYSQLPGFEAPSAFFARAERALDEDLDQESAPDLAALVAVTREANDDELRLPLGSRWSRRFENLVLELGDAPLASEARHEELIKLARVHTYLELLGHAGTGEHQTLAGLLRRQAEQLVEQASSQDLTEEGRALLGQVSTWLRGRADLLGKPLPPGASPLPRALQLMVVYWRSSPGRSTVLPVPAAQRVLDAPGPARDELTDVPLRQLRALATHNLAALARDLGRQGLPAQSLKVSLLAGRFAGGSSAYANRVNVAEFRRGAGTQSPEHQLLLALGRCIGRPAAGKAGRAGFLAGYRRALSDSRNWLVVTGATEEALARLSEEAGGPAVTLSAGELLADIRDTTFDATYVTKRKVSEEVDNSDEVLGHRARVARLTELLNSWDAERQALLKDLPAPISDDAARLDRVTGMAIGPGTGPGKELNAIRARVLDQVAALDAAREQALLEYRALTSRPPSWMKKVDRVETTVRTEKEAAYSGTLGRELRAEGAGILVSHWSQVDLDRIPKDYLSSKKHLVQLYSRDVDGDGAHGWGELAQRFAAERLPVVLDQLASTANRNDDLRREEEALLRQLLAE